jgi:hypothetical protein
VSTTTEVEVPAVLTPEEEERLQRMRFRKALARK